MNDVTGVFRKTRKDALAGIGFFAIGLSLPACQGVAPEAVGRLDRAIDTPFVSMKEVPVPEPAAIVIAGPITNIPGPKTDLAFKNLVAAGIVKDKTALLQLGKALFWDMQVGSDGVQACASCHFNAGADIRTRNQLSPGLKDANWVEYLSPKGLGGDNSFGNSTVPYTANDPLDPAGAVEPPPAFVNVAGLPQFAPDYIVKPTDFPLNRWLDPTELTPRPFDIFGTGAVVSVIDAFANATRDTNDVMSSQGVRRTKFVSVHPGDAVDTGAPLADVFNLATPGHLNLKKRLRRVEPRNAPTMINAVFNLDNFWDGRASYVFNGVNPFGFRDRQSTLKQNVKGVLTDVFVRVINSSLASQAVGPPTSDFEMSFEGRTFPDIGKKLLSLRPLALQRVDVEDSVLGPLSRAKGNRNGLNVKSYAELVEAAFQSSWWNSTKVIGGDEEDREDGGYTQMMYNFSLFFGLAVQAYEATLVSDDTPFDRYMGAPSLGIAGDVKALTQQERVGLSAFMDVGKCSGCHVLPITTGHTILDTAPNNQGVPLGPQGIIEFMVMGDGESANYDHGMYNVGLRRTTEDPGRSGTAPDAAPFQNALDNHQPFPLSYVELCALRDAGKLPPDVARFVPDLGGQTLPRRVTKGAFKAPNLRNAAYSGPYFHAGDSATLRQVVEFYVRGGNFPNTNFANLTVDLDGIPEMMSPDVDPNAKALIQGLVAFLAHGLTDERVAYERAPFDHPELSVPNGFPKGQPEADLMLTIPAVGKHGRLKPLPTFLNLDPQTP